jgi:uncharacterized alkaline shock family protein YloU
MNAETHEILDSISTTVSPYLLQLAIAVIVLIVVVILLRRRQPSSVPAFETESGTVRIARSAIVELVRSSCEQIRGVRSPRIRLKLHKDALDVIIRIKLASDCQLASFSKTLQTHLKRSLEDNLGIRNLRQVNLIVTGFRSADIKSENLSPVKSKPAESNPIPSASRPIPTTSPTTPSPLKPESGAGKSDPATGN